MTISLLAVPEPGGCRRFETARRSQGARESLRERCCARDALEVQIVWTV